MEEWRGLIGYEGIYEVSSLGRVKSLSRFRKFGRGFSTTKERILKAGVDNHGYQLVVLSKYNKPKTRRVHQLVAEAFLNHEPCGFDLVVDHINDDKKDNSIENLQLVSMRFNAHKTPKEHNTSKYKGVCWDKQMKKWKVQITINGKCNFLGLFNCEIEASEKYKQTLKQL